MSVVELGIETVSRHRYTWKHGNFTYFDESGSTNLSLTLKLQQHVSPPSIQGKRMSTSPKIRSVWPSYVHINRKEEVIIEGSSFRNQGYLQFGFNSTKVLITMRSKNSVSCFTPLIDRPTTLPLLLIADDLTVTNIGYELEFRSSCSVISIKPTWGYITGRSSVIVYGRGFVNTKSLICLFDDSRSPAIYINQNSVTCAVPYKTERSTNLRVALGTHGDECNHNISLSLVKKPHLSYSVPSGAPIGSSLNLSLVGENFFYAEKLFCVIGKMKVDAYFRSSTLILCYTMTFHETGTLSVLLSTEDDMGFFTVYGVPTDSAVISGSIIN